jgi:glycosyltransferase involved in cell wall biosynthesis
METVKELSVVMLCYRAQEHIFDLADATAELLDMTVPDRAWELVLVGNYVDGETDSTPQVVRDIASKHPNIESVALPKRGMMGWDARSGMDRAIGRYICLIDGDGQELLENIVAVYEKIESEKLDLVKTRRVARSDGIGRKILSYSYNILFRLLFPGTGVHDVNSKPKIVTRKAYELMDLSSDDWFLDAEMILKASRLKLRMGEVDTCFHRCTYRKSFINIGAVFEFIYNLMRARIRAFFKGKLPSFSLLRRIGSSQKSQL